jgi:nucleoside-diphosphate-sugar epimerase
VTTTTLVVGVGYLGQRYLDLYENARGLTRRDFDLDSDAVRDLALPQLYDLIYTVPPPRDSLTDTRLERLLASLQPAPQRFVYISTTGVYGDHGGALVNEETPLDPGADRSARRVAAEQALTTWSAQSGCTAIILRVPGIYGPGRLGTERIRERMPIVREEDVGPGNRIHVDDLAACCAAALAASVPAGIYNVGDGDHRTSTWFANEVARQCGLPPPPTVSMAEAEQQFSPMRLSFLRDKRTVDTSRMRDVLGVEPSYANPVDGIHASIREEGRGREASYRK